AHNGHPGRVVFHRTKGQASAAATPADNMTYHGGLTEHAGTTSYAIYWRPTGSYMSPTYQTLLNRYLSDVGGSGLYNVTSQYYDTTSAIVNQSSLGGSWTDSSPYPSTTLSDADLQGEVIKAINANNWPWGPDREFFVFTAKGENSCFGGSSCSFTTFCAYHSSFTANDGRTTAQVRYANQPYTGTSLQGCGVPASPTGDIDA